MLLMLQAAKLIAKPRDRPVRAMGPLHRLPFLSKPAKSPENPNRKMTQVKAEPIAAGTSSV
jgi:hypothetical protein